MMRPLPSSPGRTVNAGALAAQADFPGAQVQLSDALRRTDGDPNPPDFVTGTAVDELAALVGRLLEALPSA